jgi:hypothetical protein
MGGAMPLPFLLPAGFGLVLLVQGEAGLRVTTESSEYCQLLSVRVAALQELPETARTLAEEGRRLCATGHVRTGIAKLRRAIRAAQGETRQAG